MGKMGKAIKEGMTGLIVTLVAAVLLIILGIIFFGATLWIVNAASKLFLGDPVSEGSAAIAAAILTAGALISGGLEQR